MHNPESFIPDSWTREADTSDYPETFECGRCEVTGTHEDDGIAECAGECGNWLCRECAPSKLCTSCEAEASV